MCILYYIFIQTFLDSSVLSGSSNFTPIVSDDSFQDLKYLHVLIRIFLKIERDSKRRIHNNGTIVTAQRPSQFRTS